MSFQLYWLTEKDEYIDEMIGYLLKQATGSPKEVGFIKGVC